MKAYIAVEPLLVRNRRREPGSKVSLTEKDGARLLAMGHVTLPPAAPAVAGAVPKTDVFEPSPSPQGNQESTQKGEASQDAAPSPLNLNTADTTALEALPYIGPKTAERLIQNRPFATLDQAREASGLSTAKWAELLPQLSL